MSEFVIRRILSILSQSPNQQPLFVSVNKPLQEFEVGVFGKRDSIRLQDQRVAVIAVDLRKRPVYGDGVAASLDGLLPLGYFYRDVSVDDQSVFADSELS